MNNRKRNKQPLFAYGEVRVASCGNERDMNGI